MPSFISEAFIDTLRMLPFLLVVYFLVEWVEHKYGDTIQLRMRDAAKAGPLLGALFGCLPQCGFSIIASAMYCRRFISLGTLLAVFLSTSDEAVPVVLARPNMAYAVLPIVLTKVVIALIAGYAVDLLLKSYVQPHDHHHEENEDCEDILHERGCCEHDISDGVSAWKLVLHPIIHTLKVAIFLFLVTVAISYRVGNEDLANLLSKTSFAQPLITALIGLVPNCAASVAITQVLLLGGITFGSAISGLCASGGLGILVLARENRDYKDTLRVLGLLVLISVAAGVIINATGWHPIKPAPLP